MDYETKTIQNDKISKLMSTEVKSMVAKLLARENIKFKINANTIIPMLIDNKDTRGKSDKWRETILSMQDTVDQSNVDTLVNLITFLNTKKNYLITGQEISIGSIS